jgi:hypothetical protein
VRLWRNYDGRKRNERLETCNRSAPNVPTYGTHWTTWTSDKNTHCEVRLASYRILHGEIDG